VLRFSDAEVKTESLQHLINFKPTITVVRTNHIGTFYVEF
jgi:hypothetical protein